MHILHYALISFFFFVCSPFSSYHHLPPSCCLHFPLSSPAVDRIGVRALWPVEQVTALTWPWFHSCAFCHLPACPSHFNNVNMVQAQATENILCPGAHSLEPCCTPESHMRALILGSSLQKKWGGFVSGFNTKLSAVTINYVFHRAHETLRGCQSHQV